MKAKRALGAIISLAITFSVFAVPSYAVGKFEDVPDSEYYVDAVQWGVQNNIVAGTGDNKFSPDQTCTKAQIIAFIWRAYGCPEPNLDNTFIDLDGSEYYYKAAIWGVSKGIGVGDKEFNGDDPCSRNSAMLYLWKGAGEPTPTTKATFIDIQNTNNMDGISWAVEKGITSGTSSTTFSPNNICTRAQIISFLYRNLVKPVEQAQQTNNNSQNQETPSTGGGITIQDILDKDPNAWIDENGDIHASSGNNAEHIQVG